MNETFDIIYFGLLIGYIFYFIIDKGVYQKPLILDIITIKVMGKKYHLHHWINFSILFLCIQPIIVLYGPNTIILNICGICLGSILQGLTYKDAFRIHIP